MNKKNVSLIIIGSFCAVGFLVILGVSFNSGKNNSYDFFPACVQSITQEELRNLVTEKLPEFAVSLEPVGDQPIFDQEGNSTSAGLQFDNPVAIVYRISSYYEVDPRILLALSEVSTHALTAPKKNPAYPFLEVDESRDVLEFQTEFGSVAQQLSIAIKGVEQSRNQKSISAESTAIYQYLVENFPSEMLGVKQKELEKVLGIYFGITQEMCQ